VPHLHRALSQANRMADDAAVCHRDFLSATTVNGPSDVDHCDDLVAPAGSHELTLLCGVSVYGRAKPLTYVRKNYDAVLCCYQLGFAPDWIIHDFDAPWGWNNAEPRYIANTLMNVEGSRIDEPNVNDEDTDTDRDEVYGRALGSVKLTQPKTKAEWTLLKAALLEKKMPPAFEALAKSHHRATAPGAPLRKLDDSEDNNMASEAGAHFECHNLWDLRDEMLKVFDNAPIASGYVRPGASTPLGAHGTFPYNGPSYCINGGCRAIPVLGKDQYNDFSLCDFGMLERFDNSWVAARLAKSGALDCCIDAVENYEEMWARHIFNRYNIN